MIRIHAETNSFDILNISMEQIERIPSMTNSIAATIIAEEYLAEHKQEVLNLVNAEKLKNLVEERIVEEIKKIKVAELIKK